MQWLQSCLVHSRTALVQEIKKTDVEKKSSGLLLPTNAQNETVKRCLVISACNIESSNVETNDKVVIRGTDPKRHNYV